MTGDGMTTPVLRARRSWFVVGLLIIATALAILQVLNTIHHMFVGWGHPPWTRPGYTDFGSYYLYARMGLDHGWRTLYHVAVERQEWSALGGDAVVTGFPMIYPPPLAWLVVPFAFLPLAVAFAVWETFLLGLLVAIWRLAVRGAALVQWTLLAVALTLFPVVFALLMGQVIIPVMAAVAIAWRLLSSRHEVLAGLVLLPILLKPQIAFLVPLALLASGRWRAVLTWAIGTAAITALALASIGPDGLQLYVTRLTQAAASTPTFYIPAHLTLEGVIGTGTSATVARIVLVAITLMIAYRHRGLVPDVPIAIGLVSSLVVTPYIHVYDLTVLVVAAWIYLQVPLSPWQRAILAAGYGLLLAISFAVDSPVGGELQTALVLVELIWVLAMYFRRGQRLPAWRSDRSKSQMAA